MERRVVFLVLAAFVAAVSCNPDDDSSPRTKEAIVPADDPPKYQYQVVDEKTKVPCILANMAIALEVKYKAKDDKEKSTQVAVPNTATSTGNCGLVISTLLLTWGENDKQSTVKFLLLNDHTNFSVASVTLDLYISDAAGDRVKMVSNTDTGMLSANVGNGLTKCDHSSIEFDKSSMTMTSISLIAFNTDKNVASRKVVSCTNSTIFPYIIPTNKDNTTATLAKMTVTIEIPYTHTNGSVVKEKKKLPFGQVKNIKNNDGDKQSHSADLQWESSSNYKLSLTVREHDNGIAYIDAVAVDISIDKKDLVNATADVRHKGNLDLRLFPVALGNGLYSCKTGNVLRFGDVRIILEDVLFAPFNSEKSWEARKVTGCDLEAKKQFNYVVKDPNLGVDCILGNMTIAMNVTYKKNDNNTGNSVIQVPSNAITSGHCDAYTPYMELTWPEPEEDGKGIMNNLRLSLYYSTKTGLYYANFVKADIYLSKTQFPDASNRYLRHDSNMTLRLFPNEMINGYYKCANATEATIDEEVKIKITDILLMAFNDQEDVSIKVKESGCYKDDKDDEKDYDKNNGTDPIQKFHYRVTNANMKVPCILANMVISLKLNNPTKDGTEVVVHVPNNTAYSGTCGDDKTVLHLTWPLKQPKKDSQNSLTLTFGVESSRSFLKAIKTNITSEEMTFKGSEENMMYFAADATSCFYKCESKIEVTASNFTAIFSDLVLIAFNQDPDPSHIPLRSEQNCSSENVGAIVGGVIGGLVIIGIIWFVICTCRRNWY
ncbi:uncharacterized protein LOC143207070 [Lasioglossum baleicum]|uniref:uncharacterized protein LOC143207070 n=1 Tax=Lasioglossum baleicum TaxID=434251 RepID=UPI003FCD6827